MQKEGIDALKRMAQMAKNRLRNKVRENDNKAGGRSSFKVLFGEGVDIKSKIITKDDVKLYNKIKAMLEQDEDIINPIAKLIDYKVYNKLDEMSQERYLFDLVGKYKLYKAKFEEERKMAN